MAKRELDLRTLLDVPLWENIQEQLANLTGTAIITIDFKGNPITKHAGRTEFCSHIREDPLGRQRCFRCDAMAGLEAVRLERPYIYLCHCGIVDVAVPVLVGDRYLGAVMFGQVRLDSSDTENKVERLVNEISSLPTGSEEQQQILRMYRQLPRMKYSRIVQIADLIDRLVHYVVELTLKSMNDAQTYRWMLRMSGTRPEQEELPELTPGLAPSAFKTAPVSPSSALSPAIAYLQNNPLAQVSMKDMADLCHLSPSYFSRLFHREVGEGFTSYVNHQKIELAKEQLRSTSKSITQISSELGYLNPSHFINLFKRFEGVTPLIYRQYK